MPAAVAIETLKIYDEMDIVSRVAALEKGFLAALNSLTDHPLVGDASGVGLMGGLEIVADKEKRTSFAPGANMSNLIVKHARRNGILLRITPGRVAFSPPLIISEQEIDEMVHRTRLSLDGAWGEAKSL